MASRISTFFYCVGYAFNAMKIANHLNTVYENWTHFRNAKASTQKASAIFSGFVGCMDIITDVVFIKNRGFEGRYAYQTQLLQDQFETEFVNSAKSFLTKALEVFENPDVPYIPVSFDQIERAQTALRKTVTDYQNLNAFFGRLQFIRIAFTVTQLFVKGKNSLSPEQLIDQMQKLISFQTNAYCNSDLSISFAAKILLYPFNLASYSITALVFGQGILQGIGWYSAPMQIGRFYLIPFQLPSSKEDPSVYYLKREEKYNHLEPFNQYRCGLTQIPITKALIIVDKSALYFFERATLIIYIFTQKEAGQSLLIPGSSNPFTQKNLYIDQTFDDELTSKLLQLKEQERRDRTLGQEG
jgi:hypothetical protein